MFNYEYLQVKHFSMPFLEFTAEIIIALLLLTKLVGACQRILYYPHVVEKFTDGDNISI